MLFPASCVIPLTSLSVFLAAIFVIPIGIILVHRPVITFCSHLRMHSAGHNQRTDHAKCTGRTLWYTQCYGLSLEYSHITGGLWFPGNAVAMNYFKVCRLLYVAGDSISDTAEVLVRPRYFQPLESF
jgi:hypothetical protein